MYVKRHEQFEIGCGAILNKIYDIITQNVGSFSFRYIHPEANVICSIFHVRSWPVLVTGLFVWWDLAYGTHYPLISNAAELCRHSEMY